MELYKQISQAQLYEETFSEVFQKYTHYVVGKRVYFKTAAHVVTVEFTGTAINAATNLTLAAMTPKGGLIDAIETPFKFIFKEPKKSNMDKSVTWKNVAGNLTAGGVTVEQGVPLSKEDILALNQMVATYLEIFK